VPGGGAAGFWHAHVQPQLSLGAHAAKTAVTLSVRDAGDPVAGASVTVAGKHLKTDTGGRVALTLRPGSYAAIVSAAGYASGSVRVTVR
jgi:hypothetical protein